MYVWVCAIMEADFLLDYTRFLLGLSVPDGIVGIVSFRHSLLTVGPMEKR